MKKTILKLIACGLLFIPYTILGNWPQDPMDEDLVTVHIYRPKRAVGFAWGFNLKVDGERYTKIKNGDHLVLQLEPGTTCFSVKKKEVILNLEPGKTYYLRTFISAGVYIGSLDIVEVTASFAKQELLAKRKR